MNLGGMEFRYLIADDSQMGGLPNVITEVGYDAPLPHNGIGVRYCNLYDQTGRRQYGPYVEGTGTADQYNELVLDCHGHNWGKFLDDQINSAKRAGFKIIEWDNPDGYPFGVVMGAIDRAYAADLWVVGKNVQLLEDTRRYLSHPALIGCVIEQDDDHPANLFPGFMDQKRAEAAKPHLPIWFVTFGKGHTYGVQLAASARGYKNMQVSWSQGEYNQSIVLR
jgi:hypothetical protein